MDTNEITCPKCGHLNNYISEGCVKCGIIFSKYFEMQDQQQEPSTAEVTSESGKENENLAAELLPTSDSVAPATAPADDVAQAAAEPSQPVAEITAPAEAKQEETQSQPAPETSAEAEEKPADTLTGKPEKGQPIAQESAPSGKDEQTIDKNADKTAVPESQVDAAPVQKEVPTADQVSVQETEAQVTQEAASEPATPALKSEATEQPAGAAVQVEPAKSETEAQPAMESGAQEVKPPGEQEKAPVEAVEPVKDTDTAKNNVDGSPSKHENKIEAQEKAAKLEAEAEILLAEVAEPIKAKVKSEKTEDNDRVELLKKQKAALAKAELAKAEVDKKKKEARAKAQADKKKKEARAKAAALKKQKLIKLEAIKKQKAAQAKALKKKKAELAKAAALKKQKAGVKAEALKQQKASQVAVEKQSKQTQTAAKASPAIQPTFMNKGLESSLKIMGLLKKYEGQTIGINYDNSAEIKEAELVEANDEFFSVAVKDKKLQFSYPLQTLLSLVEGEDGVEAEESESKAKFSAVIKVYPLVLF